MILVADADLQCHPSDVDPQIEHVGFSASSAASVQPLRALDVISKPNFSSSIVAAFLR
jgi:hypothetical protein